MSNNWAKLAGEIQRNRGVGEIQCTEGSGNIGFITANKTVLKFVAPPNATEEFNTDWFLDWRHHYPGTDKYIRTFMVYAIDVLSEEPGIMPWVLSASVMAQVFALIADGYALLDPIEGTPISINKVGEGLQTRYQVNAMPTPYDSLDTEAKSDLSLDEAIDHLLS